MNGNTQKSILVCLFFGSVYVFSGCQSVPRNISGDGAGAVETRNNIDDIRNGQTELAITGERIENGSDRLADGLKELDGTIEKGQGDIDEFKAILREIRSRKTKDLE